MKGKIQQPQTMLEFIPGPVKIKDGLFMGDQIAAKDIEFIISNKVTHIINTVSKKIPNLWERFGIHYLSVNWTEKEQNIFDKKNNAINTIFHFVEEAMEQGESCLIHSVNGKTRACAVMVGYLMKKYEWGLDKCLEFVASKKENLQIRNGYLLQLKQLDKRMSQIYNLTGNWKNAKNQEELLLKNTFANSRAPSIDVVPEKKSVKKHVSWLQKPTIHKVNANKSTTSTLKEPQKKATHQLKSILKGDQGEEDDKLIKNIEDDGESFDEFDSQPFKKQNNYINNINGNIVHVTVNNFITSEKKKEAEKPSANTRPYSSDQKERQKEKDKKVTNPKKMLSYDTPLVGAIKSPYDSKLANRIGSNNKLPKQKKQEKQVKPPVQYQRPQSAKHRSGQANKLKADMMIVNSNVSSSIGQKKRYPSNPRQQLFKRK